MPEQRMVSMKMFLVSIGLLLVLNIGIGAVLYKDLQDREDGHRKTLGYISDTITTIEEDIAFLDSQIPYLDAIRYQVCENMFCNRQTPEDRLKAFSGDSMFDRLRAVETKIMMVENFITSR